MEIPINTIRIEDCRVTMAMMADKCCDVFTDPPYNVGIDYGGYWDDSMSEGKYKAFIIEVFTEIKRIGNAVTIFTPHRWFKFYWDVLGDDYMPIKLWHPAKNGFYKNFVSKGAYLLTNAKPDKKDQVENIWMVQLPGLGYYSKEEETGHPAYTTLDVARRVVKKLFRSQVGYDPFMGKGTTAVACVNFGKDFIGSELNEDYVKYAEARIVSAKMVLL